MSIAFEQLTDRVQAAIEGNPHFRGKTLRFESKAGRVVLKGQVKSYFEKQMAQEAVRRVEGVEEVRNDLEVSWS